MVPNQTNFPITDVYVPFLGVIFNQIVNFWWLWLFLILFWTFKEIWVYRMRKIFEEDWIDWVHGGVLYEIRLPREIKKTPKAMEQVLLNLYTLKNSADDIIEIYWDGEVTLWWSLEIASLGGELHFYIRSPEKHKSMTQACFYGQYPEIELVEVPDYLHDLPEHTSEIYQQDYNFFGSEFILSKPDYWPIRTYAEFPTAPEEEETLDPISSLIEAFSKIDRKEKVYLQILIRPAVNEHLEHWVHAGEHRAQELKESGKIEETYAGKDGVPVKVSRSRPLSTYEQQELELLENKISKPAFETIIRYIYLSPNAIYSTNFPRRGLRGALNQYSSNDSNSFKSNSKVETRTKLIDFPHIFLERREEARRQRLLYEFHERKMPEESFMGKVLNIKLWNFNWASKEIILNVEELATIFHPPTKMVLTSPSIKLLPSKKMGAPAGLPVFADE
ncbi:hypothetical protein HY061_00100 [Candidatus Azambacteria bacterium]|nr:hypothetical protein [Candidatus Azambacteria bacterium]